MYMLYLGLEWLGRHPVWTALGVFIMIATFAIVWYFDYYRHRSRRRRQR